MPGSIPILSRRSISRLPTRKNQELILLAEIMERLATEIFDLPIMFKVSIPTVDNFYAPLIDHPSVLRVVALSGGYSRTRWSNASPAITA